MAIGLACQIVIEDFNRPQSERRILIVWRDTVPGDIKRGHYSLPGKVKDMSRLLAIIYRFDVTLVGGPSKILVSYNNEKSRKFGRSGVGQSWWCDLWLCTPNLE